MTEHDKTPKKTRYDNEGGREFGHVHSPSQTQLASQNRGLADDSMRDDSRRKTPPGNREAGAMSRRGHWALRLATDEKKMADMARSRVVHPAKRRGTSGSISVMSWK